MGKRPSKQLWPCRYGASELWDKSKHQDAMTPKYLRLKISAPKLIVKVLIICMDGLT